MLKKDTDKLANATRKLERQTNVTAAQLEQAEKERIDMEAKKKEIEKELAKVSVYLQTEKTKSKNQNSKVKKGERDLKKKEQQVLEEKQKRETNEQVTLETTAEAELLKTKLIDSQLEKERLEATSRKLANSIENMKEDITQQEESKEKDLHDLDKKT